MTTDKSRADAMTDDRIEDAIYRHIPPKIALENAKALYAMAAELLAASSVEQPAAAPIDEPTIPAELHHDTAKLVRRFARALANKLLAAQRKYGYSDNWMRDDWADECRAELMRHIHKGDPRDVAAYCAFLWHHNESTAPAPSPADAPAHASECPHCDGEGTIEGDSGMSPCTCQRDAQEGTRTFDAPAEARERDDPELIAADCYHWIAERIGTKDGYSVQEHVDAMCQVIDECADFFHDFVGADEGGNDEAVRIAKNIRALKAGTLQDVSAPADAEEAAAWRYRASGDNWRYCDREPVHVCDRDYEKQPLYTAPPAARVTLDECDSFRTIPISDKGGA